MSPAWCKKCQRAFSNPSNLRRHISQFHRSAESGESDDGDASIASGPKTDNGADDDSDEIITEIIADSAKEIGGIDSSGDLLSPMNYGMLLGEFRERVRM